MRTLAIVAVFALNACATTTETVATCKAADAVTTLGIIKAGGHELNPIAGAVLHYGALPFIAAEAAVVWIVSQYEDSMSEGTRALVTLAACAGAAHNAVELIP